MTFHFRPAVRSAAKLMIGLAGPSGSGKTFSALLLAAGLADGKPIYMIDTESGRGLHYADMFRYQHAAFDAPFSPDRYLEAIKAAHQAGAGCIIVDSMSHESEGPGGILEMHESILQRMAGNDHQKREKCKFAAWIEPKRRHNLFMNGVLQVPCHMIFCYRAKDKLAMVKNADGKLEPVSIGWQPICADRFEYEMTALFMLPPRSKGVPDLDAPATKAMDQLTALIEPGRPIDSELGKRFAKWAAGSGAPPAATALDDARAAARQGREAFTAWWNGPGKARREQVRSHLAELQAMAEEADRPAVDDDNPFPPEDEPAPEEPTSPSRTHEEWAAVIEGIVNKLAATETLKEFEVVMQSRGVVADMRQLNDEEPDKSAILLETVEGLRRERQERDA